ncbi:MAG: alpha/beta hydrolase-fold protein [Chloroflexota bacterium]
MSRKRYQIMKKSICSISMLFLLSLSMQACKPAPPSTPAMETPQDNDNVLSSTIEPTTFPALSEDTIESGQHAHSYLTTTGEEIKYLLYIPENYDQKENWPLIVFFHGYGAYGGNLDLLIKQGGLPAFLEDNQNFEFVVLSPQLPSGRWGKYINPVDELLDHLNNTLSIDPNRYYLTGLSLGALGTWQYALEYPDRFAAIAPIAGGVSFSDPPVPDNICTLKELSIWVFHGDADTTISPDSDKAVVAELEACGADIKFTLYPDTDHAETWPLAYGDPSLYEWFLGISK